MATCRKCNVEYTPAPYQVKSSDFICKPCQRIYQKEWRKRRKAAGNPVVSSKTWDEEKRKAWMEKYYNDPEVKKRKADYQNEYRKNPATVIKNIARRAVRTGVESGRIVKQPCAFCGKEQVEAHHLDYKKPLLIVWLCRKCHTAEHRKATGKEV